MHDNKFNNWETYSSSNGIEESQPRKGWMEYVESMRSEITYVNT